MNTRNAFALVMLVVFLPTAASLAGESEVAATGIDVALVDLETPLSTVDGDGAALVHHQAYLVRLQGRFPATGAKLFRLFVGDTPIEEYGSYPGGLYFYVPEKSKLTAMNGKTLRWKFSGQPLQEMGIQFDTARFEPFVAMSEKKALERR